jgi:hypothetical protein
VLEGLLTDEDTPLATRHQLLCVQTVFTILSGQGEFLTIDPTSFYAHLYRNLLPLNAGEYKPRCNTFVFSPFLSQCTLKSSIMLSPSWLCYTLY